MERDPIATAAQTLSSLAYRWQDEHEYEDFADYVAAMTKALPAGSTAVKMTKRPFRVEWTHDGKRQYLAVKGNSVEHGIFG